MNLEELLKNALRDDPAHRPAPADLADRVLAARRRRARVRTATATAAIAAVAGLGLTATQGLPGYPWGAQPASARGDSPLLARPDQSPPRELVAAGDVALGAHYTVTTRTDRDGRTVEDRAYRLLDRTSGTYRAVGWSYVDVAPGLRTAAVLAGELPTRRIGLVDLDTGEVTRWLTARHPVAAVAFSPDGRRLVATRYARDPAVLRTAAGPAELSRTGFGVIDTGSGTQRWHTAEPTVDEVAAGAGGDQVRADFDWSRDGLHVHVPRTDLGYARHDPSNGLPPSDVGARHLDGTPARSRTLAEAFALDAGDPVPAGPGTAAPAGGGQRPEARPLAWPARGQVITWSCAPKSCADPGATGRLVLVDVARGTAAPLSGTGPRQGEGRWEPVFAPR
ncbi:hypothetical protein ACSMX9_04620 [Streptomyces sp. LE64]|uniref:hypothetical protein n=1 Tax=Streptomyces sp. LE64 TaxID=3448653 RepID=UPI00404387A8